jgi:transposase
VTEAQTIAWADEMRVGLHGTCRRVWGQRGTKVHQRVQIEYEWRYLFLAVDGRSGRIWTTWLDHFNEVDVAGSVLGLRRQTPVEALVWDGAAPHRAELTRAMGLPVIVQPPYAPELNPAERVIQELRRAVEGRVYATLDDKIAAIEARLAAFDADPAALQRLTGWAWLRDACAALSTSNAA